MMTAIFRFLYIPPTERIRDEQRGELEIPHQHGKRTVTGEWPVVKGSTRQDA